MKTQSQQWLATRVTSILNLFDIDASSASISCIHLNRGSIGMGRATHSMSDGILRPQSGFAKQSDGIISVETMR
jgi:hypothetical protein